MATEAPTTAPDNQSAENIAAIEAMATEAESEDFDLSTVAANDQQQAEPEPEGMQTGELCTALLSIGFSLVAARKGPHWALQPEEASETGNAVGAVLDKYFPGMAEQGPEITALMCVGMVVGPRLMMDAKIEAERGDKAKPVQGQESPAKRAAQQAEKQDAPPAPRFDLDQERDGE